jgi:hypothetical protein
MTSAVTPHYVGQPRLQDGSRGLRTLSTRRRKKSFSAESPEAVVSRR